LADEIIKVTFRMTLYAIFFILIYRSFILTLKTTVSRLSKWKSKREKYEDEEFVLIIETLILIASLFIALSFSFFEEHTQLTTLGRNKAGEIVSCEKRDLEKGIRVETECIEKLSISESNKDILVSLMSILLTAIVVYSLPVIGELEVAIKHKIESGVLKIKTKKSN